MNTVKADLHMHVNNNITRKIVTTILKESEKKGLKAISMLEHFYINLYNKDNVLNDIIQNEGIETYYSGKVVSGVEVVCSAQDIALINGENINGRILHILMYDFDYTKANEDDLFSENAQIRNFNDDTLTFLEILKKLKLPVPALDYFVYEKGSCVSQLHRYISDKPEILKKYIDTIGPFSNKTEFIRDYVENPKGILYYPAKSIPTIIDLLKFAKKENYKLVIAHPAYMLQNIDYKAYIDALIELTYQSDEYQKFWGIEGPYMLNSAEETADMIKIAKEKNMVYTCGSDSRYSFGSDDKLNQMYFTDSQTNDTIYYTPEPGLAIKAKLENGDGDLKMPADVLDALNDVRKYYK